MLHLRKAVRFRGVSSLVGISSTSKTNTHPFTTLGSANRSKLIRPETPSMTLARDKKLSAAFSTQSPGLRKVMWTDYCYDLIWDLEVKRMMETNCRPIPDGDDLIDHAMFAFDCSNPFGDIDDQNCVIVFERAVATTEFEDWITHDKMNAAAGFLTKEAAIVQKELNKAVVPDGQTIEWPVLVGFNDYDKDERPAYADVHISFKIPDTEDPEAFETRLRESGLKGVEFRFGSDEEVPSNIWWIYCLYTMPKENKYWEKAWEEDD